MMKAKTQTYLFLVITACILSIIPAHNVVNNKDLFNNPSMMDNVKNLYNMDLVEGMISNIAYSAGISTDSNNVLIGKDGWLFLGNVNNKTLDVKRFGITEDKRKELNDAHSAAIQWKDYLLNNGVKDFKILIGPDKDTIYKDELPKWDAHASPSVTELLLSENKDIYVDALTDLIKERESTNKPLYFKTDSHWNFYGGSVAFNRLADSMKDSGIVWPSKIKQDDLSFDSGYAGDLAAFLRMKSLPDNAPAIKDNEIKNTTATQINYETGDIVSKAKLGYVGITMTPTRILSDNYLNDKKVLWIRDSYGTSISPWMIRTFKDILEVHHDMVSPTLFKKMVSDYKPDYVIFTVVERNSLVGISKVGPY